MKWRNLFGDEIDEFVEAKERYGLWPTTLWVSDMTDRNTRMLKEIIGDDGLVREGALQTKAKLNSKSCYTTTSSIFNPALCSWILNCYAPRAGICYDPFAGGGTRAVMATKHGLEYVGLELREAECIAIRQRCKRNEVEKVFIYKCNSCEAWHVPAELADFSYTCPPYYNLEQYQGGEDDLSMLPSYMHFCAAISRVLQHNYRILKPDTTCCWVVGMFRGKEGDLVPLHHDITRLALSAGFRLKEEIVLQTINNGSIQRVGNFEKGNKFLVRVHEYILVFRKGALA